MMFIVQSYYDVHCPIVLLNCFSFNRYDPRENCWSYVSPMQVKRKHLGVAVHEGCLYAVGGRDECFELSSVEKYASIKQW